MIRENICYCQVDITGKCNLNCLFCRQTNERSMPDEMSIGDWRKLFYGLSAKNCNRISIAGGEPLLHKDLEQIISLGLDNFREISVLTNGTLITKEIAKRLRGKVTMLQVSLDSFNPKLHDKIRGHKGLWSRTVQGIRNAIDAEIPVGVRITIFRDNYKEIEPLIEWAKIIGAYSFLVRRVVCSGSGIDTQKLLPSELKEAFQLTVSKALELNMRIGFGDPFPHLLLSPKRLREAAEDDTLKTGNVIGGCSVSIDSMYVTQDGTVLLCPYLPIYCGNLRKQSVEEIWEASDGYKLARSIRYNLQGKCGRCEYKYLCGGCRANAYYETGNVLAEDSGCWHEPVLG